MNNLVNRSMYCMLVMLLVYLLTGCNQLPMNGNDNNQGQPYPPMNGGTPNNTYSSGGGHSPSTMYPAGSNYTPEQGPISSHEIKMVFKEFFTQKVNSATKSLDYLNRLQSFKDEKWYKKGIIDKKPVEQAMREVEQFLISKVLLDRNIVEQEFDAVTYQLNAGTLCRRKVQPKPKYHLVSAQEQTTTVHTEFGVIVKIPGEGEVRVNGSVDVEHKTSSNSNSTPSQKKYPAKKSKQKKQPSPKKQPVQYEMDRKCQYLVEQGEIQIRFTREEENSYVATLIVGATGEEPFTLFLSEEEVSFYADAEQLASFVEFAFNENDKESYVKATNDWKGIIALHLFSKENGIYELKAEIPEALSLTVSSSKGDFKISLPATAELIVISSAKDQTLELKAKLDELKTLIAKNYLEDDKKKTYLTHEDPNIELEAGGMDARLVLDARSETLSLTGNFAKEIPFRLSYGEQDIIVLTQLIPEIEILLTYENETLKIDNRTGIDAQLLLNLEPFAKNKIEAEKEKEMEIILKAAEQTQLEVSFKEDYLKVLKGELYLMSSNDDFELSLTEGQCHDFEPEKPVYKYYDKSKGDAAVVKTIEGCK